MRAREITAPCPAPNFTMSCLNYLILMFRKYCRRHVKKYKPSVYFFQYKNVYLFSIKAYSPFKNFCVQKIKCKPLSNCQKSKNLSKSFFGEKSSKIPNSKGIIQSDMIR